MEARNPSPRRRSRWLDLADPALWAWGVVVVMLVVPTVGQALA